MRVLLTMMLVAAFSAATAQRNFIDQNYIEVTGKATIKIIPDQIYLRIQISEKQKTRANLEAKEREMITGLKALGIDVAKDLVIKDLASNFRSKIFDDNIVISKMYVLLIHDAKTANKVIAEMEKLEISNIKVDHLDHSKMSDYKKECSVLAMAAAKTKAESLTHAIGQSTGRAIYIEEVPVLRELATQQQNYAYKAEASTSSDWFITDLEFDEIAIDYVIMARFELK